MKPGYPRRKGISAGLADEGGRNGVGAHGQKAPHDLWELMHWVLVDASRIGGSRPMGEGVPGLVRVLPAVFVRVENFRPGQAVPMAKALLNGCASGNPAVDAVVKKPPGDRRSHVFHEPVLRIRRCRTAIPPGGPWETVSLECFTAPLPFVQIKSITRVSHPVQGDYD